MKVKLYLFIVFVALLIFIYFISGNFNVIYYNHIKPIVDNFLMHSFMLKINLF